MSLSLEHVLVGGERRHYSELTMEECNLSTEHKPKVEEIHHIIDWVNCGLLWVHLEIHWYYSPHIGEGSSLKLQDVSVVSCSSFSKETDLVIWDILVFNLRLAIRYLLDHLIFLFTIISSDVQTLQA